MNSIQQLVFNNPSQCNAPLSEYRLPCRRDLRIDERVHVVRIGQMGIRTCQHLLERLAEVLDRLHAVRREVLREHAPVGVAVLERQRRLAQHKHLELEAGAEAHHDVRPPGEPDRRGGVTDGVDVLQLGERCGVEERGTRMRLDDKLAPAVNC